MRNKWPTQNFTFSASTNERHLTEPPDSVARDEHEDRGVSCSTIFVMCHLGTYSLGAVGTCVLGEVRDNLLTHTEHATRLLQHHNLDVNARRRTSRAT